MWWYGNVQSAMWWCAVGHVVGWVAHGILETALGPLFGFWGFGDWGLGPGLVNTVKFKSQSDTQTTPILTQSYNLIQILTRHSDYSHPHTDTQTTPISNHTLKLLPLWYKDYSNSVSDTHRLLPSSIRHSEYSYSQSDTQSIHIFTQTHRLLQILDRHSDFHYHWDT